MFIFKMTKLSFLRLVLEHNQQVILSLQGIVIYLYHKYQWLKEVSWWIDARQDLERARCNRL